MKNIPHLKQNELPVHQPASIKVEITLLSEEIKQKVNFTSKINKTNLNIHEYLLRAELQVLGLDTDLIKIMRIDALAHFIWNNKVVFLTNCLNKTWPHLKINNNDIDLDKLEHKHEKDSFTHHLKFLNKKDNIIFWKIKEITEEHYRIKKEEKN